MVSVARMCKKWRSPGLFSWKPFPQSILNHILPDEKASSLSSQDWKSKTGDPQFFFDSREAGIFRRGHILNLNKIWRFWILLNSLVCKNVLSVVNYLSNLVNHISHLTPFHIGLGKQVIDAFLTVAQEKINTSHVSLYFRRVLCPLQLCLHLSQC